MKKYLILFLYIIVIVPTSARATVNIECSPAGVTECGVNGNVVLDSLQNYKWPSRNDYPDTKSIKKVFPEMERRRKRTDSKGKRRKQFNPTCGGTTWDGGKFVKGPDC